MKVIFIGNETVDVSAIQSASVVFDDKRFEVCVIVKPIITWTL